MFELDDPGSSGGPSHCLFIGYLEPQPFFPLQNEDQGNVYVFGSQLDGRHVKGISRSSIND